MLDSISRDFHAYDGEVLQSPWAFDKALRRDAPVFHDTLNDIYLVSSYELMHQVIHDPERFSSRVMEKFIAKEPFPDEVLAIYGQGYPIVDALLVSDGETHDRHRRIITKAFSRKRLDELAPIFDARIASLLDKVLPAGAMRFRADIADSVPLVMTQEQLRMPDADMERAWHWSEIISSGFGGMTKSVEQMKAEAAEIVAFQRYFENRIHIEMDRVRAGAGERDDDLLTMLAQAVMDPADPMDMVEALSFLFNLFPATHDTTTASLTACMHRLTESRTAQELAEADPSSIIQIVEEGFRHESPIRAFWRRATTDVELGGVSIPAGAWVLLRVSAANRDEATYPAAETFDPQRKLTRPHLSFSTGIHTCAGRAYARHIIVAVLTALVRRARNFRFSPGANDFSHVPNLLASPYEELYIDFDLKDAAVAAGVAR